MIEVSEDAVRTLFAQTVEPFAVLLTIASVDLNESLRFTDYPGKLGSSRVQKGLTSRGDDFLFYPFSFSWTGAGGGEVARDAEITIGNTSGEIADALEQITDQPALTVEMVRVATPDVVERAMTNAVLVSAEEDGPSVKGTIKSRQFDTEPACSAYYLPARTPALF